MDQPAPSPTESRGRAVSSEPCSTRPNPFDDDAFSARKRRRTSLNGASPSPSARTTTRSPRAHTPQAPSADSDASMTMGSTGRILQTPEPETEQDPELRSKQPGSESRSTKITLNLKTTKQNSTYDASPTRSTGLEEDLRAVQQQDIDIRASVEDGDGDGDASMSHASSEHAGVSSHILENDDPPVEIVDVDEGDTQNNNIHAVPATNEVAQVAMLEDGNPFDTFPCQPGELFSESLPKLCSHLVNGHAGANAMSNWIETFLSWAEARDHNALREIYTEYSDFWQMIPQLVWQYSSPLRNPLARSHQWHPFYYELHKSFARLAAYFVDFDATWSAVAGDDQEWQDLVSTQYIAHLHVLLNDYAQVLMPNTFAADIDRPWHDMMLQILDAFRLAPCPTSSTAPPVDSLLQLGLVLADKAPQCPRALESLAPLCGFISGFARAELRGYPPVPRLLDEYPAGSVVMQGYDLFEAGSRALAICIDRSVNQIAPSTALDLLNGFRDMLRFCLQNGPEQAIECISRHQHEHPEIPKEETVKVIVYEWRLQILTQLIMTSQMHLRIMAAQTMCSDMVRIWKDHHDDVLRLSQHPVLRHFSERLKQSQVISYILGPTCHPEVTAQSYNIIGFLFASHTFADEQMDLMWRTVTTCQISGVSDSLLMVIANICNLFTLEDFLRVFQKIQTVRIEDFTPTMKDFCDKLISQLLEKNEIIEDLLPYSLMFRLLRESSAPGPLFFRTVQKWASNLILQLIKRGPSLEDRQRLIQDCLADITQRSRYTLGSLGGLLLLCRPGTRERDLQQLVAQYDLPPLLVDELEHAITSREEHGILHLISGQENAARLELLTNVFLQGSLIPEQLGRRLWDLLVGPQAASHEDRDCAWQKLSVALRNSSGKCFVETCFTNYFPTLPPALFRTGSLDFVLQRVLPLVNGDNSFILEDDKSGDHLGIEQLWRIALTAPVDTIERRAITALVKDVYLENRSVLHMPVHRVRKIHLSLVSRCMTQLSSAAKYLTTCDDAVIRAVGDTDAVMGTDGLSVLEQEMLFTRTLTIVREFHNIHQKTPRFSSPDLRSFVLPEVNDVEGDSAELKFQSFDGSMQTDVKPLSIGRQNTAGSLLASIRDATGFDNYRLYYKGRPFTPSEGDICRSLEDLQIHNGLILVKREMDADEYPVHARPGSSPVEVEIMKHFEELWQYLALKDDLASELYSFLITLPVSEKIVDMVANDDMPYSDVFPIGQPLKSLYALHAIREHLSSLCPAQQPEEVERYQVALRRALTLIVSALCDHQVISKISCESLKAALALQLVEQLLTILGDPMRPVETADFLDDVLSNRLVNILSDSLSMESTFAVNNLTSTTFRVILDICSLKRDLWESLQSKLDLGDAISRLLLDDTRATIRQSTGAAISDKSLFQIDPNLVVSTSVVSAAEFRDLFRPLLIDLIPRALIQPAESRELFDLLVILLTGPPATISAVPGLSTIVRRLYELLLQYKPSESAGIAISLLQTSREEEFLSQAAHPGALDLGAFGLINLLHTLLCDQKETRLYERLHVNSGTELFWRHLFTRRWTTRNLLWTGDLIYNELSRVRLNNIVLTLVGRDLFQLATFFDSLAILVPYVADENDNYRPYRYDLPYAFDRSKEIRAACGYAGLRNLSNTCYLSSLCTQLFMNYGFRQFMLSIPVDRKDPSQELLWQTQNLFGQLQSSHQRFVDPEAFVCSIKTYDDDMINIHNQMDVEEFFNLLTDRWEGQLRSSEAVRRFRSFYGGQLVTQTRSKECEHISEVMEPFSAIQCDIKGKKNLLESLEAYVDGEHMEGDNKYKCSSCDRHVDAVRRSCLKEIPNSLIFHLKRFDFNLRTQSRSKINDYFAFPERIDMRPYTVEHLSNSPGGDTADLFELVGVLVHAGTAESGHYYSFIRERPTSREDANWFEFNDDMVSPWHPSKLEACCFGGTEASWEHGCAPIDKNYCAYMLFYERSSALEKKQQDLQQSGMPSPAQSPLSGPLWNIIRDENLRTLQRHCLFDPNHIKLVHAALERLSELNEGSCSKDHQLETTAIEVAVAHLDQVASRAKDVPGAERLADQIKNMVDSCPDCALAVYEYLNISLEAFRSLVQRNPEAIVRKSTASILLKALSSIKRAYPRDYCIGALPTDDYPDDVVNGMCGMFDIIWEGFHYLSLHRSWPEVFGLMAKFVCCGKDELVAFLTRGFLSKTLLIFITEYLPECDKDAQFSKFCNLLNRRPNRLPCYVSVIELLKNLLIQVTPEAPIGSEIEREQRYQDHPDEPVRMTLGEVIYLDQTLQFGSNALMEKVISLNQNTEAVNSIIVHILDRRWHIRDSVLNTLLANTAATKDDFGGRGPYLRAAKVFRDASHDKKHVDQLNQHIAEQSIYLARSEPEDVWNFFKDISTGLEDASEIAVQAYMQRLKYLPMWAPALLVHHDPAVAVQVESVLQNEIFRHGPNPEIAEGVEREQIALAISECARQLGQNLCEFANEAYIKGDQTVSSQTVTLVQRVLGLCAPYFNAEEEPGTEEAQAYLQNCAVIVDHLRRLGVDILEDDGSGMLSEMAN
ncbi:hypothetical protein BD289DRAFT_358590 [Coniella lustricola]|uniref:USP domain-containing protein n=1 Tax=Coniella lustricola TaxID=2025994 RepID=A0A2T3AN64_9PEZI|nr:hypothetical protein BD289DRAFT_358590 [Coniella lustricola]